MQSHITLIVPHDDGHEPTAPVVELHRGHDREVRIWFHEADDERVVLTGCPECLVWQLRTTAERIADALKRDDWS